MSLGIFIPVFCICNTVIQFNLGLLCIIVLVLLDNFILDLINVKFVLIYRVLLISCCIKSRPINLSLSQFLKDGCIGERQMAYVCKKHKRPEGQQMAHILILNMY